MMDRDLHWTPDGLDRRTHGLDSHSFKGAINSPWTSGLTESCCSVVVVVVVVVGEVVERGTSASTPTDN